MRLFNVKEVTPTDIGVYIFTFLNFMSCLALDFYLNKFFALKIWFIFFSVPFAFLYFINIVNQKSYDIKVSLDVSFIFVSMAFIGILIMGYPDLKKELANRSKEKKLVEEKLKEGEFRYEDFVPLE
jgi:hypothetical protein|tara:strand:+ start:342 stop:719 length:378 start_codon:yes stop_codon:yes gene_type:complete